MYCGRQHVDGAAGTVARRDRLGRVVVAGGLGLALVFGAAVTEQLRPASARPAVQAAARGRRRDDRGARARAALVDRRRQLAAGCAGRAVALDGGCAGRGGRWRRPRSRRVAAAWRCGGGRRRCGRGGALLTWPPRRAGRRTAPGRCWSATGLDDRRRGRGRGAAEVVGAALVVVGAPCRRSSGVAVPVVVGVAGAARRGRGRTAGRGGRRGVAVGGRDRLREDDLAEPQLGGLADQLAELVLVGAGDVDLDVLADDADLGLGDAEAVDPGADDVDGLVALRRADGVALERDRLERGAGAALEVEAELGGPAATREDADVEQGDHGEAGSEPPPGLRLPGSHGPLLGSRRGEVTAASRTGRDGAERVLRLVSRRTRAVHAAVVAAVSAVRSSPGYSGFGRRRQDLGDGLLDERDHDSVGDLEGVALVVRADDGGDDARASS